MPVPYQKQTWVDGSGGGTPISAARLGVIEQGIYDAQALSPGYVRLVDEFTMVSTEDGEIGEMGWRQVNSSMGSPTYDPGTTDHMGVINCSASTTSGNIFGLSFTSSPAGNGFILPAHVDRVIWIARPVSSSASLYRLGLCQDPTVTACGTDGVWWDYSAAANANWRSVSRGTSTNTTNNSSVAVTSGNWYKLEIRRTTGGDWEFWLNDALKFTHTTNKPATAVPLIPFAVVEISSTTSKQLAVDYFGFLSNSLGNRYT